MGFFDNLTGQSALTKVEASMREMERVYAAMATRMIEILETERQLHARHAELERRQANIEAAEANICDNLSQLAAREAALTAALSEVGDLKRSLVVARERAQRSPHLRLGAWIAACAWAGWITWTQLGG